MFRIRLDTPADRVHFPGSLISGVVEKTRSGRVSRVRLTLLGTLLFETYRAGYGGNSHAVKEYRFIDVDVPLTVDVNDASVGGEWPFTFVLPKEVDWYRVDREWNEPLGVEDISLIPTDLPPSVGNVKSRGEVTIFYNLVLTTGSAPISSRTTTDRNGDVCNLYVCPTRRVPRPNPQIKMHIERFNVYAQSSHSDSGERRNLKSKIAGALHAKSTSGLQTTIMFHLPQVCVVGETLPIEVELSSGANSLNGSSSPRVILQSMEVVLKSHTLIDVGLDFERKGRDFESHSSSRAVTFDGVETVLSTGRSVALPPETLVSAREMGGRFKLGQGLSPSFQTLGLGRSYSIEVVGEVKIDQTRMTFGLKKQMIRILPSWSDEQQRVMDAGATDLPADMPPPAYSEVVDEASAQSPTGSRTSAATTGVFSL